MDPGATADSPSCIWRTWSNTTMWGVAGLCRAFLSGLCHAEIHGGEAFTALLDSRRDPSQRSKGLITGAFPEMCPMKAIEALSNHVSVYVPTRECGLRGGPQSALENG
ncbi:Phospholipid/glycerol acyltransferase [Penicillium hispanicum]|uniref:Phospholipid/glycerol acyltransferase n=1 Tax=Penicillium hispanicum TaxID=1080232 RepID=UPI00253F8680|nr:Phospholipid/glycerol acyltransferase [Penicillium hispanicum]KAJ5595255.1 Phospholipid/glycerol acyltransferase [Penicillium hispanicum]